MVSIKLYVFHIFKSTISDCHGCDAFIDFDETLPKDVTTNNFEYVSGYVSVKYLVGYFKY